MSKRLTGTIVEILPNAFVKVELEDGTRLVVNYTSERFEGKIRLREKVTFDSDLIYTRRKRCNLQIHTFN